MVSRTPQFKTIHSDGTNWYGKVRRGASRRARTFRGVGRKRRTRVRGPRVPSYVYRYDLPKGGKPGSWSRWILGDRVAQGRKGYHTWTLAGLPDNLERGERLFLVQGRGAVRNSRRVRYSRHGMGRVKVGSPRVMVWRQIRLLKDVTEEYREVFGRRGKLGQRYRQSRVVPRIYSLGDRVDMLLAQLRDSIEEIEQQAHEESYRMQVERFLAKVR